MIVTACAVLILVESARYAEPRREIREANGHAKAVEADETS